MARTHNLYYTKLYQRWAWIKNRCFNPNTEFYPEYGGRGITLYCDWVNDPKSFVEYCKTLSGWDDPLLTLDRINNDGNYEPNNIRFVSRTIQSRNRRIKKDNKTGYAGITKEIMPSGNLRYRASVGVNNKKIAVGSFRTAEEAYEARVRYILENHLEGYNVSEYTFIELIKKNK
jgi:hypothetical protein